MTNVEVGSWWLAGCLACCAVGCGSVAAPATAPNAEGGASSLAEGGAAGDTQAGSGGDAGHGQQQSQQFLPEVAAFQVHATLRSVELDGGSSLELQDFDFTAHMLLAADGRYRLELASGGEFSVAKLASKGRELVATPAKPPPTPYAESGLILAMGDSCVRIALPQLVLSAPERDEHGHLTGFTARASGQATGDYCPDWYGDVSTSEQVELMLTASVDEVPPRELDMHGRVDPLLPFSARFNEAVTEQSSLTLQVGGAIEPLSWVRSTDSGAFWGVTASPLLGFDVEATWSATVSDFAGNVYSRVWMIRSDVDPGVLPQDGFETEVPALRNVEPGFDEATPISGARSLLIESYDVLAPRRVAFHLARGAGNVVRFNTQELVWDNEQHGVATLLVRVGVVGSRKVTELHLPDSRLPAGEATPAAPPEISAREIALTEPGSDVIVSFELSAEGSGCDDVYCEPNVLPTLVDDLRIE
jgi:hypothetical protein